MISMDTVDESLPILPSSSHSKKPRQLVLSDEDEDYDADATNLSLKQARDPDMMDMDDGQSGNGDGEVLDSNEAIENEDDGDARPSLPMKRRLKAMKFRKLEEEDSEEDNDDDGSETGDKDGQTENDDSASIKPSDPSKPALAVKSLGGMRSRLEALAKSRRETEEVLAKLSKPKKRAPTSDSSSSTAPTKDPKVTKMLKDIISEDIETVAKLNESTSPPPQTKLNDSEPNSDDDDAPLFSDGDDDDPLPSTSSILSKPTVKTKQEKDVLDSDSDSKSNKGQESEYNSEGSIAYDSDGNMFRKPKTQLTKKKSSKKGAKDGNMFTTGDDGSEDDQNVIGGSGASQKKAKKPRVSVKYIFIRKPRLTMIFLQGASKKALLEMKKERERILRSKIWHGCSYSVISNNFVKINTWKFQLEGET
jgi:hypothetical protein